MDDDVQEASMERVVLAAVVSGASAAGAQAESPGTGYRLKLKDGHNQLVCAPETHGAAAAIIAQLPFLDASDVWTSLRAAGAACIKS